MDFSSTAMRASAHRRWRLALWWMLIVPVIANSADTAQLLDALRSGSALERAEAAQALAYERDTRIGPALVDALRDKDKFVRWRAAEALAVQEYPNAAAALEQLATDDPDPTVRTKAEVALARIKQTVGYAIYALRESANEQERSRAAAKLAFGLETPEIVSALIAALLDKSIEVRAAACESLRIRKLAAAVPALIGALDNANAKNEMRVASAAAEALGAIGDPRAVDALVAALQGQAPDAAVKALGALKDPRAVAGLIELTARADSYRYPVAQALKAIGPNGLDALIAALDERPPRAADRRYAIAMTIRYTEDPRLEDGALRLLSDADPAVRRELAMALGRMKSRRAVTALTRLIDDPDQRLVAPVAVGALGEIGDRSSTATLLRLLADPARAGLHDNAIGALTQLRDPAAADALAARLKTTSGYDRLRTAQALCAIGGARAKTALLAALRAGDRTATNGAHRCLIGYGESGTDVQIAAMLAVETQEYDEPFAQTCFLSGNATLRTAAEAWAQKRQRKLSDWTSQPLRWGEKK
jgi:HEAT repeat protein